MLPIDKSLLTHPSLFQTPIKDKKLDASPDDVRNTDPTTMWDVSDYGVTKSLIYNEQDPPISHAELRRLLGIYKPVAEHSFENQEKTLLFGVFMSQGNIDELQLRIRRRVFDASGFRVGNQSQTELVIAMLNVYGSYANSFNENLISKKSLFNVVRHEVDRLDGIVVKLVVPVIVNTAEQLTGSIKIFNDPNPMASMPPPVSDSIYGTIEYRPIEKVLSGHDPMVMAQTNSLRYT